MDSGVRCDTQERSAWAAASADIEGMSARAPAGVDEAIRAAETPKPTSEAA